MTENPALSCADLLAAVSATEGQGAELKDPATGEAVGYAPQSTSADLDEAVTLVLEHVGSVADRA